MALVPEAQVIISYKQLEELLKAVEEIPQLRAELKRYQQQVTALRGLYSELQDRIGELMRLL